MEPKTAIVMVNPRRRAEGQHLRAASTVSLRQQVLSRGRRPQGWHHHAHRNRRSLSVAASLSVVLLLPIFVACPCAADASGAGPPGTLTSGDALVADELEELLLRARATEQETENAYARATAPHAYLVPSILNAWYLPTTALTHCSRGDSQTGATGAGAGTRTARVLWGSCAAERDFPPVASLEGSAHGPANGTSTASGDATSSASGSNSRSRAEGGNPEASDTTAQQQTEDEAYRKMCIPSAYRTLSPGALARVSHGLAACWTACTLPCSLLSRCSKDPAPARNANPLLYHCPRRPVPPVQVALFGGLRRRRGQHLRSISLFNAPLDSPGAETGTGTGGSMQHAPRCSDLKPLVVHLNAEGTMGAEDPLANLAALLQRPEQALPGPTARVTLILHAPLGVFVGRASQQPERERERQAFIRMLVSVEDHLRYYRGDRCLRIVVVHFLPSPNATAAPLLQVQAPEAAQLGLTAQTSAVSATSTNSRGSKHGSSNSGGGSEGAFGALLRSEALECRLLRLAVGLGVEVRLIAVHLGSVQSTAGAGMHIGCKVGALPPPFLISSSVAYAVALAARLKAPGRKGGVPSDLEPPPPPGWQGICFFLDSTSLLLNPQQSSPTMATLASEAMASWVNVLSQAADDSPLSKLGTQLLQGTRGGPVQGEGGQGAAPSVVQGTARALGSMIDAVRGTVDPLQSFFSPLPFRFLPNLPWSILPGHTGRWDEASFSTLAVAYSDFVRVGGVPFWHQQAPPWWSPGAALKDVLLQSLLQWPTQMLQRLPHHLTSLPPATPQGALSIHRWECPEIVHLPQGSIPTAASTTDITASGRSDEVDRSEE